MGAQQDRIKRLEYPPRVWHKAMEAYPFSEPESLSGRLKGRTIRSIADKGQDRIPVRGGSKAFECYSRCLDPSQTSYPADYLSL